MYKLNDNSLKVFDNDLIYKPLLIIYIMPKILNDFQFHDLYIEIEAMNRIIDNAKKQKEDLIKKAWITRHAYNYRRRIKETNLLLTK